MSPTAATAHGVFPAHDGIFRQESCLRHKPTRMETAARRDIAAGTQENT
jgi:hypothetical protein